MTLACRPVVAPIRFSRSGPGLELGRGAARSPCVNGAWNLPDGAGGRQSGEPGPGPPIRSVAGRQLAARHGALTRSGATVRRTLPQ